MVEESVPFMVGGSEYRLRYEPADVIALERDCMIGYTFIFEMKEIEPGKWTFVRMSLTHLQHVIRRGLRIKNTQGDLQYAYPQDSQEGLDRATKLIQIYLKDGNGLGDLMVATRGAMISCGWPMGAFASTGGKEEVDRPKN